MKLVIFVHHQSYKIYRHQIVISCFAILSYSLFRSQENHSLFIYLLFICFVQLDRGNIHYVWKTSISGTASGQYSNGSGRIHLWMTDSQYWRDAILRVIKRCAWLWIVIKWVGFGRKTPTLRPNFNVHSTHSVQGLHVHRRVEIQRLGGICIQDTRRCYNSHS